MDVDIGNMRKPYRGADDTFEVTDLVRKEIWLILNKTYPHLEIHRKSSNICVDYEPTSIFFAIPNPRTYSKFMQDGVARIFSYHLLLQLRYEPTSLQ